jgi:histidinol dehydrogenase
MDENNNFKLEEMSEFFKWFFLTTISKNPDEQTQEEFINKIIDGGGRDENGDLDDTHNIKIIINGVEVNPLTALSEMQKQFDDVVQRKISEKIKETISDKINEIHVSLDILKTNIEENIDKIINL